MANTFQGLFSPGANAGGWQANAPDEGNQVFDWSGAQAGARAISGLGGYQARGATARPFTNYNLGALGSYGTSTPGQVQSAYETAFAPGMRAIRSQGTERMRQLGQGFGAGNASSAAQRQLVLRNAQQTGADVQDLSSQIGSGISQRMLGQQETEREQNRREDQSVRDQNWAHQNQVQQQNADEMFRYNQFSDEQARAMAQDALNRANLISQYGLAVPELQGTLSSRIAQNWQTGNSMTRQLAGYQ